MNGAHDQTARFKVTPQDANTIAGILREVYQALLEKGYSPVNQLVGYLLSGDPTYITSHRNARNLIRKVDRDELLEELVKSYLERIELK